MIQREAAVGFSQTLDFKCCLLYTSQKLPVLAVCSLEIKAKKERAQQCADKGRVPHGACRQMIQRKSAEENQATQSKHCNSHPALFQVGSKKFHANFLSPLSGNDIADPKLRCDELGKSHGV